MSHKPVGKQDETYILIGGGSDEHCCAEEFGKRFASEPSDAQLRDAQGHRIPITGEQTVHVDINMGVQKRLFRSDPLVSRQAVGQGLRRGAARLLLEKSTGGYCRVDLVRLGNTLSLPVRIPIREASDRVVCAIGVGVGASLASFDACKWWSHKHKARRQSHS